MAKSERENKKKSRKQSKQSLACFLRDRLERVSVSLKGKTGLVAFPSLSTVILGHGDYNYGYPRLGLFFRVKTKDKI